MNNPQRFTQDTVRVRLSELNTMSESTPAGVASDLGPPGDSAAIGPAGVLEILRGPDAGHRFILPMDTVTTLGRDPGCHIVLPSVTVSRRHAEIRPTPHGFELTDTGSLNGVYLNGTPIDTAPLTHHDHIQVGIFRLAFYSSDTTNSKVPAVTTG